MTKSNGTLVINDLLAKDVPRKLPEVCHTNDVDKKIRRIKVSKDSGPVDESGKELSAIETIEK